MKYILLICTLFLVSCWWSNSEKTIDQWEVSNNIVDTPDVVVTEIPFDMPAVFIKKDNSTIPWYNSNYTEINKDIIEKTDYPFTNKKDSLICIWDKEKCWIDTVDQSWDSTNKISSTSQLNSITTCNKIEDKYLKYQCTNDYYYSNAMWKNDLNICKKLPLDILREDCKNLVYIYRAMDKKDKEICNYLNSVGSRKAETVRRECVEVLLVQNAMNNNDKNICNNIQTLSIKQECNKLF